MITTRIITHTEGKFPVTHKYTGFAKNFAEWKLAMQLSGWQIGFNCEDWSYEIERIEWPESEQYFPTNYTELWVLGGMLKMN